MEIALLVLVCGLAVAATWWFIRERSFRKERMDSLTSLWWGLGCTAVGVIIGGAILAGSTYMQSMDTEMLNGQVVSKARTHGSYTRTYDCNCYTTRDSKGNTTQHCQTCYEHHYTVSWDCNTTVGAINIDSEDSLSSSVYHMPDPAFFTRIQPADPVARAHTFLNYIKGSQDSLFHANQVTNYDKVLPAYPDRIYDYYNVDRVLAVGVQIPDLAQWNRDVANILRQLGPQKQANVVIVFTNSPDEAFAEALRNKWLGGKKNDVVVVVGAPQYPNIAWVNVFSWTDKEIFKIQLRDQLMAQKVVDRAQFIKVVNDVTMSQFQRKHFEDFNYLQATINPSMTALILAYVLGIILSVGSYFFFQRGSF